VDYTYPSMRKVWAQRKQSKVLGVELIEIPQNPRWKEDTGYKSYIEHLLDNPSELEDYSLDRGHHKYNILDVIIDNK